MGCGEEGASRKGKVDSRHPAATGDELESLGQVWIGLWSVAGTGGEHWGNGELRLIV